jgi:hypothetical protein
MKCVSWTSTPRTPMFTPSFSSVESWRYSRLDYLPHMEKCPGECGGRGPSSLFSRWCDTRADMDVKMLIYPYAPDTHTQAVVRGSEDGLAAVKVLPYIGKHSQKHTSSPAGTRQIDLVPCLPVRQER